MGSCFSSRLTVRHSLAVVASFGSFLESVRVTLAAWQLCSRAGPWALLTLSFHPFPPETWENMDLREFLTSSVYDYIPAQQPYHTEATWHHERLTVYSVTISFR